MLTRTLRMITRLGRSINIGLVTTASILAVILLLALTLQNSSPLPPREIAFKSLHDKTDSLEQNEAFSKLNADTRETTQLATNRSEHQFWLLSSEIKPRNQEDKYVEIPSRHTQNISFWIIDKENKTKFTGAADKEYSSNEHLVKQTRAGFAIRIPHETHDESYKLLIRIKSSGPAKLNLFENNEQALAKSEQYFDRSGGILFGSILMIAVFSGVVSTIAKDITFLIFGAWVIFSLRIASYSAGWDFGWLDLQQAEKFTILARNFPLAAYAFLTVTLFWAIFKRDIATLRLSNSIRALLALSLSLLLAAIILPHRLFLPLFWSLTAPSVGVLIWLTIRIFARTGSASAAWYGASWIATLMGGLSEIAFAAGLTAVRPTLLSNLGSTIGSALLAAIAVAQRLNAEKSARMIAQARSLEALSKFQSNYNSMPVGLFSIDNSGIITLHNPEFSSMFGEATPNSEILGRHIDAIVGTGAFKLIQGATTAPVNQDLELGPLTNKTSDNRWFLARVTASEGSIEGSIQDITTRKEAEAKLKLLVDHDSLTGLLNRRGLEEALRLAQVAARDGVPCAIAHVDIDRFKLVNDLYGHAVGDGILQAAAARFNSAVRSTDRVARLADSFIIILMDCPDHAVTRLTERLREMISEQSFDIEGVTLNMTVSIGVVTLDPTMSTVDAMAAADRACAEAKAHGRNCVIRLNERDDTLRSHLEELKVVAGLRQRVPTERYFLEFQPIVALRAANQSLNYEVLIRMRDDAGGVIPPGKFIGAAERNGLMSQIDRWVLLSTLEWLDQHPAHRDRLNFATLNLSGASLNDVRFIEDAFAMIADHPIAATKLCFEITESIALNDVGSTRRFVDRVRAFGSKLALDDFGAGYTSFNYLKEIPADFIKIDGSFVKDINQNPGNYAITRTIVDLTHELGMSSIAEWAETADTIASLIHLQVDYGQGFGLARPLAKELVTNAASSISLVRDPAVVNLLVESNRQVIAMHPASPRRS